MRQAADLFVDDSQECRYDVAMAAEYFKHDIGTQLSSLLEENTLKDTTVVLRASRLNFNSCILSLVSPVLRVMLCGSFRESISKEIILHDVDSEPLLKLLQLACGRDGVVIKDAEELLELADRLQMEAVRTAIEDQLSKRLEVENCLDIMQRSEGNGLELLHGECYKMLRDEFGVLSQKNGFLKLSEETMGNLLEDDELGVDLEEDVFEALARWMRGNLVGIGGETLLKVRYGLFKDEYLTALMTSSALLPGHVMLKNLVGEALARKQDWTGKGMWDGVERLCDKWKLGRIKGRFMGLDVLKGPAYALVDGQGHILVSDTELHQIVVFDRDGSVARRIGSHGKAPGQFTTPLGIAVDRQDHIIVADFGNHRIQVLNADGSVARCFGSYGSAVGQLDDPYGLVIDGDDHIVVADVANHRIQVFAMDGSVVRHFGSRGAAIGQLDRPAGLAVDKAGRVVVADCGNHRVQVFNRDGSVALCFGSRGYGRGQLKHPEGVAVDSVGRFIVADTGNDRVQVFNSDGSVAGVIGSAGSGVGELLYPRGVVADRAGRFIVVEGGFCGVLSRNNRMQWLCVEDVRPEG